MPTGSPDTIEDIVDPREAARSAGLVYVSDDQAGIRRKRQGKGFVFIDPKGRKITDPDEVARIRKLAIPPAYRDVWICRRSNGHIQATGRDARGRKQYRYHAAFREVRDAAKFGHMLDFAKGLPHLRERVRSDMARRGLPREKVLATLVHLLETTLIRVGNDDYARANKSYGLTTLKTRHVEIDGTALRFAFRGKSGKMWNLTVRDRRVARIVREIQDLPGQHLFQYADEAGVCHDVTSADVNAYLREVTGRDVTAKDFRTWAGTVLAALALREFEAFDSEAGAKRNVRAAIEHVAARLGNTPTICRKCYVHPDVLVCYLEGALMLEIKAKVETELRDHLPALRSEEAAVLGLLQNRLTRDLGINACVTANAA